ncbi:MAG: glycoside hydrolase family 43 protein [Prolixibacteraceae bacterium]
MKKLLTLLAFIFVVVFSQAAEKAYLFSYFIGNGADGLHLAYSIDGLNWKALNNGASVLTPQVGKDKLMRDPSIVQGPDGKFHMVWTSGWWDQYIGYASSNDLLNWSEQQLIPVMQHEPEAKNSWAPELFYDEANAEYLIFWATTIPGRHAEVAESEREKGLNHRIYSTSTKDFKNFTATRLFFNPDFSAIDAAIIENKGEFILFLKNENPNPPEKNIRFTKAKQASGPYPTKVSAPITGNYWAEGPTPLKIGEYIYVYFDKYRNHQYGAVRSKDLSSWEDVSELVNFPSGIRHGTAFEVSLEFLNQLKTKLSTEK